jgi:hypothetical protein
MDSGRPVNSSKQQLNQYLNQMQSEVGRSGKSLHQISSDYLTLKSRFEGLAQELENLDISDADQISLDQFENHCAQLSLLQSLQTKVLQGAMNLKDHPWRDFAHPDLHTDDFELLLRTLRFVSIQLSKFWVEVQSFPLFLNVLSSASVQEIERIFQWLQSGPAWHTLVQQPRIIPALVHASSRKVLLEFARDVKSVQALQKKLALKQDPDLNGSKSMEARLAQLGEAIQLTQKYNLGNSARTELEDKISHIQERIERIQKVQEFFTALNEQTDFPRAEGLQQAKQVFEAIECIRQIPEEVIQWRQPRVLAPGQMVRIKAWQDRAKPILDIRKRLEVHMNLESDVTPEELRELAAVLTAGGMFRTFKNPYKDAIEKYRSLLALGTNPKSKIKDTALQMGERLTEWASYIEQVQAFESNAEAKATFGSLFKGVDTDFRGASLANTWAARIRTELGYSGDAFGEASIDFIFRATESQLKAVVAYFSKTFAKDIEGLLKEPEFETLQEFKDLAKEEESKLEELMKLLSMTVRLGIHEDVALKSLEEIRTMNEEISFLVGRMDANADLKNWLKNDYRGPETDLTLIEQGLFYVQFIENSDLPESLKNIFLSVYGPQRYGENRALVSSALASLATVKEHLLKLDAATHGQVQNVIKGSIPDLLSRIQIACRQPALLDDWVNYLKCERNARIAGLNTALNYFDSHSIQASQYIIAYELALNASLLKKAIRTPGAPPSGPALTAAAQAEVKNGAGAGVEREEPVPTTVH